MVANHSKKTGVPYELPHLLEATASILMHYVKTGERLYTDNPWTYTWSQDVDKGNDPLIVGGFTPDGFNVSYYSNPHIADPRCCGLPEVIWGLEQLVRPKAREVKVLLHVHWE